MDEIDRLKQRLDDVRPLRGEQMRELMSLWEAQTANYRESLDRSLRVVDGRNAR